MDLRRGKELEVDTRQALLEGARDVGVVREVEVRVLATDHVDLGEVLMLAHVLRVGHEVADVPHDRIGLLRRAGEGAELALHAADRRVVEIQVVDEVHVIGAATVATREVGQLAEFENVVRLEQRDAVVEVKAFARDDLLANFLQCGVACNRGHGAPPQVSRSTTPRTTIRSGAVSRSP